MKDMNFKTPLCKIAYKYGTDKCPQISHHYTPVYYELLKNKRKSVKKVLELGIGSREVIQWVPEHYQTGASLLMWRDFFPNAQIYGVDIAPSAIFQTDRIKTFLLNTTVRPDMSRLIHEIGPDVDLVVDDGSHRPYAQVRTFKILKPLLKKDVIYVIEDVGYPEEIKNELNQLGKYNYQVVKFSHEIKNPIYRNRRRYDNLVIVKNV